MQSLLLKLQADIESRKRPHWDIAATVSAEVRMCPSATTTRAVTALSPTSTIRGRPRSSRCVNSASLILDHLV